MLVCQQKWWGGGLGPGWLSGTRFWKVTPKTLVQVALVQQSLTVGQMTGKWEKQHRDHPLCTYVCARVTHHTTKDLAFLNRSRIRTQGGITKHHRYVVLFVYEWMMDQSSRQGRSGLKFIPDVPIRLKCSDVCHA